MNYPDGLPIPNATPYNWDVGLGVVTTQMNAGNRLLRRKLDHLPHQFAFVFSMDTSDMNTFVMFVDLIGSDWFNIPALSMWTVDGPNFIKKIPVRFITNLSIDADGFNWWNISIGAEISPDVYWNTLAGPWIDAGHVYQPSINWIDGGIMPNASPVWIDAGTVSRPSGRILEAELELVS